MRFILYVLLRYLSKIKKYSVEGVLFDIRPWIFLECLIDVQIIEDIFRCNKKPGTIINRREQIYNTSFTNCVQIRKKRIFMFFQVVLRNINCSHSVHLLMPML